MLYSQNNNRNIPLQHETPTDIGTTNSENIVLQLQQNTQQQNYSSSSSGPIRIKQTNNNNPLNIQQHNSSFVPLSQQHPQQQHPPPHQHQRILIHHQNNPLMTSPDQLTTTTTINPTNIHPQHPQQPIHSSYIGSQRFAMSVLNDMDTQSLSPKTKYRELKKKFKFLVYENEYYQEELRNLQRKLLKLSRDKNFLLDRLGQHENLSESSDDSDTSTKTLDDKGIPKPKRKRPSQARKRPAPNTTTTSNSLANNTSQKRKTGGGGGAARKKGIN
uniref:INO80 complex subunit E n=1 Tax=Meloidogyne javanica TaxID=6303 RepID=A0A915MBZ1_MELJA